MFSEAFQCLWSTFTANYHSIWGGLPGSKFSSIGLHKDGEGMPLLSSSICPLFREMSQYRGGQRLRPWIHFSHFDLCYINISGAHISPEVKKKKKSPNPKSRLFGSAPSLIHCWPCLCYLSFLLLQSPFDLRASSANFFFTGVFRSCVLPRY